MLSRLLVVACCLAAALAAASSPSLACRTPLRLLRGGADDDDEADVPMESTEESTEEPAVEEAPPAAKPVRTQARGRGRRGRGGVAGRGRARGRGRGAVPVAAAPSVQADPAPSVSLQEVWRGLTAWEDPIVSGVVFGVINAAFILAALQRWSAAALLGAVGFYSLLGAAGCTIAAQLLRGFPPVGAMVDAACAALPAALQPGGAPLCDAEIGAEAGRLVAAALNAGFDAARHLAAVAQPAATAGALLGALALKCLGKYVGLLGLAWAAVVVAFALPPAKLHFREQFDELHAQASALVAPFLEMLPDTGLGSAQ